MKIEDMIVEEIKSEIEEIGKIEVGSDTHEKAVNSATKLMDRHIKMKELEIEENKIYLENERVELEKKKVQDEKHDRWVKNATVIGTTVGGALITVVFARYAYRFEEYGTITTKAGHKMVDKAIEYFFKH